jgi:hypothetical protein
MHLALGASQVVTIKVMLAFTRCMKRLAPSHTQEPWKSSMMIGQSVIDGATKVVNASIGKGTFVDWPNHL